MLLVRPSTHADECIISYLIRVSEKNGFKHIGHLLHYAGLGWKNNRAPIHQILTGEFDLTPILIALGLPESNSKNAFLYQSFKRVIDTPYFFVKYPKVCPDCIEELNYCKSEWSLLPVVACVKHKKMLVDLHPDTRKRLSWYRKHLNQFDDSCIIKSISCVAKPSAIQLSQYATSFLSGAKNKVLIPVVLYGLELRESLSLIHFLAHFQNRLLGGSFNPVMMENNQLGQCYQKTWKLLYDWPDSFYALLSQYVDRPMSSKGIGGLSKHYRDLYERLHRQQENQGIARIKSEFDRYVEVYWPGVLEPERLTRIHLTAPIRNIISKKEAAKILNCRLERVNKLVQQKKLTLVVFKGKAHYLRDEVEELAVKIKSNWTMAEACRMLQLTRYQLKLLLDADIIHALQKPDILNRDWIINKAQCLALVGSLCQKARKSKPPLGVVSMAGIQRQGYSIVQLVLAMKLGAFEYSLSPELSNSGSFKQFIGFKINSTI